MPAFAPSNFSSVELEKVQYKPSEPIESGQVRDLYRSGQLRSSSGQNVTNPSQAHAIRMSLMRKEGQMPPMAKKRSLGRRLLA